MTEVTRSGSPRSCPDFANVWSRLLYSSNVLRGDCSLSGQSYSWFVYRSQCTFGLRWEACRKIECRRSRQPDHIPGSWMPDAQGRGEVMPSEHTFRVEQKNRRVAAIISRLLA